MILALTFFKLLLNKKRELFNVTDKILTFFILKNINKVKKIDSFKV